MPAICLWICVVGKASVSCATSSTVTTDTGPVTDGLHEVVVTGTRQDSLQSGDAPAPLQLLSHDALLQVAASPDLMSVLAQIVPSLTLQAYGEDMAGQTLQAKLRGLSPNHVLVLVNGKRRHTTANLAVDIGSPYQGGAGVDLDFIPLEAIDHIEVMTQGASAQYGTDAIAGVINIILKKGISEQTVRGTYGRDYGGDGNTGDLSGEFGAQSDNHAYASMTAEVRYHGHTNVGGVDERLIDPAIVTTYPNSNVVLIPGYPSLSPIEGDAEYHLMLVSLTAGISLGDRTELYAFSTYGVKNAASFEFFRLPTTVQFTDAAMSTTYPLPYGFLPQEATHETDYSLSLGIKGVRSDWRWDLASTIGGDRLDLYTLHSANAGIYRGGPLSTRNFYDGLLRATQWATTLDVDRDFDVGGVAPLNVGVGSEYRREGFGIGAGVPDSYLAGGVQSYPGFTPTDAGQHDRSNYAVYLELAGKPVSEISVDVAGRFERYSDFGSTVLGKLSARWDFTQEFALRAALNNGFRAPTLAEEFYSSTTVGPTTAFVQLPPNSTGGRLLGLGNGLQPEKSKNASLGFQFRPTQVLEATFDLYQIILANRIVGSGQLVGSHFGTIQSSVVNAAITANGNQLDPAVLANGLTGVNVFANGVDTRTRGADLTFTFPAEYPLGRITYSVGATYNVTSVTGLRPTPTQLGIVPLFDAAVLSDLTTANPSFIVNLGAHWTHGRLSIDVLEKIYGPAADYENDDGDNFTGKLVYFRTTIGTTPITNLKASYQVSQSLNLAVGATNLFNVFPPKLNATLLAHANDFAYGDNLGAVRYPQFSPFGINGGFYFASATLTF